MNPRGVAYDPDNQEVYVANSNSSTVSVIDTFIHQVIFTIPIGSNPFGVAYDPDNQEVYVANAVRTLSR